MMMMMIMAVTPEQNYGEEKNNKRTWLWTGEDRSLSSTVNCKGLISCGCCLVWQQPGDPLSVCALFFLLIIFPPVTESVTWITKGLCLSFNSFLYRPPSRCFASPHRLPPVPSLHPAILARWFQSVGHCSLSIAQRSYLALAPLLKPYGHPFFPFIPLVGKWVDSI